MNILVHQYKDNEMSSEIGVGGSILGHVSCFCWMGAGVVEIALEVTQL